MDSPSRTHLAGVKEEELASRDSFEDQYFRMSPPKLTRGMRHSHAILAILATLQSSQLSR